MKLFSKNAFNRLFLVSIFIAGNVLSMGYLHADSTLDRAPPARPTPPNYFVPLSDAYIQAYPYADDECCSDPGKAVECWEKDAQDDGVWCDGPEDCISGACGANSLCTCLTDNDCNDGVAHFGVCNEEEGFCGPSYCNGALVCSCWGGCIEEDLGPYENPNLMCQDTDNGYPGFCCDGAYPRSTDGSVFGYCSDNPTCNSGCSAHAECNDGKPCTHDECIANGCVNTNLDGTAPETATCPYDAATLSIDCSRQWCTLGECSIDYINTGGLCAQNQESVDPGIHADCYDHRCSADGRCEVVINEGAACDDSNDCTAATCDASGACIEAPFDDAALAANPECCDPAKATSFDDGWDCTEDTCPTGTGNTALDYHDRNMPDATLGATCCVDSTDCNDGNDCTSDICCSEVNKDLAVCGGDADYECNIVILDQPGCCDSAPASLADNCLDAYDCTENICCPPGSVDPECVGIDDYHCADEVPYDAPPAGCCDPSGDPAAYCDDSSSCTADSCDSTSMACVNTPQSAILGCCGPGPTETCGDFDGNVCSDEVCCDPVTIAAAGASDACFGVEDWSCDVVASPDPGCCADATDCDDGNPCTEDTCVDFQCGNDAYGFGSVPAGCCTAPFGDNDAQCADGSDPNDCTDNICCSEAMTSDPTSPCNGLQVYRCANGVKDPLPADCCTPGTVSGDCNPTGNICIQESCANNNCTYTPNTVPAECCDVDGDCPQPDAAARPCLDSSSCDKSGDEISNANFGHCDLTYVADDTVCGAGDVCWDLVCDSATHGWDCVAHSDVPAPTHASAVQCGTGLCKTIWCNGSGGCDHEIDVSITWPNDTCTGTESLGSGDPISEANEENSCGQEDYSANDQDRFSTCAGNDYADTVYNFDDTVGDTYELVHRVVQVDPGAAPDWNPFIYTQTTCGDSDTQYSCNDACDFTGTNYNATYYGVAPVGECSAGAAESTAITGPWAVEDAPNHNTLSLPPVASQDFDGNNVRDAYDVEGSFNTTLIVDSRFTASGTGGEFSLLVDEELHNNNHCVNTAAYVAAPIIDGTFQWKERWRGNIDGYDNYFSAGGPLMGLNAAVSTDSDPAQAFFKVEIPSGSGKYLATVDWYGLENRGEAGYDWGGDAETQAGTFFNASLSWLDPNGAVPSQCDAPPVAQSVSYASGYPPQWVIDASSSDAEGWLAVGNYTVAARGDYELTLVKAQPDFFGFVTGYSKEGAQQGCGTLDYFDGEGIRLDFVPSGTTENAYLMTIYNEGAGPDACPGLSGGLHDWGWLVHPYCYAPAPTGVGGALDFDYWNGGGHHQVWKVLPFRFPLGDTFYTALYFDSTGRIEPREMFGSCTVDANCTAYSECTTGEASCICVADLGNQCAYNPGAIDIKPDVEDFFQPYTHGGYAPVIAGAWGPFYEMWGNGTRGYLTAQTVAFEGTLAYVISWLGYDFIDDSDFDRLPTSGNWSLWESHISYQVILRPDGRIIFYYRPNTGGNDGWDEGVDRNGWVAGISGGISITNCGDDGDCVWDYGSEAQCDDGSGAPGSYSETDTCYRQFVPLIGDPPGDGLGNES